MRWIIWIVIGVAALFFVVLPTAVFLIALIEKRRVTWLEPLEDDQRPGKGKAEALHREALAAGLLYFRTFRDRESKLMSTRVNLYLSEDGVVMMLIPSLAKAMGYRLYSRMADGVWLVSGPVTGEADLSGLHLSASHSSNELQQVMAFHLRRVQRYGAEVMPFEPETMVDDMRQHDLDRAEAIVAAGYGRWTDVASKSVWVMNLRGALRVALDTMLIMPKAIASQSDDDKHV